MESDSVFKADKNTSAGDKGFQTGKILALSIAHFIHDVYSSFLAPLLPLLIEKLSMSLTRAGFLSINGHANSGFAQPLYRCAGRPHQRTLFCYSGHGADRHTVCDEATSEMKKS